MQYVWQSSDIYSKNSNQGNESDQLASIIEFVVESTDSQLLGTKEHPDFGQPSMCDMPQELIRWNSQDNEASHDQNEHASLQSPSNSIGLW